MGTLKFDVHRIARPFHVRAIGVNHETCKAVNATGRRVVARQPLRILENDGLASAHWNRFVNLEDVPLDIGGVHLQTDCGEVWSVLRRSNLRRHGQGLGSHGLCESTATAQHQNAPSQKNAAE
jgi:hypothetical protein